MKGLVIWPLVVRKEGIQLVEGYCRALVATLGTMKVSRIYTYIGALWLQRSLVRHKGGLCADVSTDGYVTESLFSIDGYSESSILHTRWA